MMRAGLAPLASVTADFGEEATTMCGTMTLSRWALFAVLAAGLAFTARHVQAQMDHSHTDSDADSSAEHDHQMSDAQAGKKVRCALDGSLMKLSAMVQKGHDGDTVYFCNEREAALFPENPERYLSSIKIGHLQFNVNILTVKELMDVMADMGMGGMMGDMFDGKTHRVAVYVTQHNQSVELGDVTLSLRLTNPGGVRQVVPLTYNNMIKTYDGAVTLTSGEEHQIGVLITTSSVDVSI